MLHIGCTHGVHSIILHKLHKIIHSRRHLEIMAPWATDSVTNDVKKDVNATLDFLKTVIKGHFILGCSTPKGPVTVHARIYKTSPAEQLKFIKRIAKEVTCRMGIVDSVFQGCDTPDTTDGIYNYSHHEETESPGNAQDRD